MLLPISVLLLLSVLVSGILILREDARRQRISKQVHLLAEAQPKAVLADDPRRNIRFVEYRSRPTVLLLGRVFGAPVDSFRLWPPRPELLAGIPVGYGLHWVLGLVVPAYFTFPVGILGFVLAARWVFNVSQRRRANKILKQMPDAIQLVIGTIRAGLPVAEALRILGRETRSPTLEQFGRASDELALGTPAHEAMLNIWRRTGVMEYAIFSMALSVQSRSGGQLAETIQVLADTIRERLALAARARALAGEAILSAQLIGGMPIAVAILLSFLNPGYLAPLLHDPRGRMLLAYAIFSWLFGALVMWWLIRKGTTV